MAEQMDMTLAAELVGREAVGRDGDDIGEIEDVYADMCTGDARWAALSSGFLGRKKRLVPLDGATIETEQVTLPYEKSHVKDAPEADGDERLSEERRREVLEHYGLMRPADEPTARERADGDAIAAHEEVIRVGKREVAAGTVKVRKRVVREPVEESVELSRETAQVERRRIDEPVEGEARIQEEEIEIPLHREESVVHRENEER
ncbi:MAG TPA: PRC and DUF2382 domain-containing protein [Gaiellaceae bacterium]|nr:PRC and DUF2382 domain-containing protein [Gaiellaceae bacterium]